MHLNYHASVFNVTEKRLCHWCHWHPNASWKECVCDMIKTIIKWVILNRAPTHSHALPSTSTYLYSFLTHSHSFPALSHQLPLMFSLLLLISNPPRIMCRLPHPFPVHIEMLIPNPTHHHHSSPYLVPYFTCLRALRTYVLMCLCVSCAHVPMQSISMHFTAYVYILYMPLCLLIRQDYLFTLRFFKMCL